MRVRGSESGFTLIETMVSAGLLAIAAIAASYAYMSQRKVSSGMSLQSQSRGTLHGIISAIGLTPERFPLFLDAAGNPLTYVGCFEDGGVPRANYLKTGSTSGFIGVPNLPYGNAAFEAPITAGGFTYQAKSTFCQTKANGKDYNGGVEVHVGRYAPNLPGVGNNDSSNILQIRAFILATGTTAGLANNAQDYKGTRNFQVNNAEFGTSVQISVPPVGNVGTAGFTQPVGDVDCWKIGSCR